MKVDEAAIKAIFDTRVQLEAENLRVKVWMLSRAVGLDFLIKQTNLSEMSDKSSLEKQVDNLTKILALLDDDKSATSKWSGLMSKKNVHDSKLALQEYIPKLK